MEKLDIKIILVILFCIIIAIPTWFDYESSRFAWYVNDVVVSIQKASLVFLVYLFAKEYFVQQLAMGYYIFSLKDIITVFLDYTYIDKYDSTTTFLCTIEITLLLLFFSIKFRKFNKGWNYE